MDEAHTEWGIIKKHPASWDSITKNISFQLRINLVVGFK